MNRFCRPLLEISGLKPHDISIPPMTSFNMDFAYRNVQLQKLRFCFVSNEQNE